MQILHPASENKILLSTIQTVPTGTAVLDIGHVAMGQAKEHSKNTSRERKKVSITAIGSTRTGQITGAGGSM